MIDPKDHRRALGSFPTGVTIVIAFDGPDWHVNPNGAPLLPGASAQLDCIVHGRIDAEDHEILLGRVENCTHTSSAPLVYCRGAFFAAPQPEGHP